MSRLKRLLLLIILPVASLVASPPAVVANTDPFLSDYATKIEISPSGEARVTQTITITNQTSDYFLSSHLVSLGFPEVSNLRITDQDNLPVSFTKEIKEDNTLITITPNRNLVGVGKQNRFTISFTSNKIAAKKGIVWEIVIPGVKPATNLGQYQVDIRVPRQFGEPTEKPTQTTAGFYLFRYQKADLTERGRLINFGKRQLYRFEISYALKNTDLFTQDLSVTLPPTINGTQQVFFEEISPPPVAFYSDSDGNQFAKFRVRGGKEMRPTIKGFAVVWQDTGTAKQEPAPITEADKQTLLQPSEFWQTDSEAIQQVASQLATPADVYHFVVETIKYDKVFPGDELIRKGAEKALREKRGVCTEFSDLLVALLRARGIPAQSLAGYGYTEDENILANLGDDRVVLHSWARWWDDQCQCWRYADPTWGASTGLDYFQQFDTNHIVFAIHGADDTLPYSAGSYVEGSKTLRDTVEISFVSKEPDLKSLPTFQHLEREYLQKRERQQRLLYWVIFASLTVGLVLLTGSFFWLARRGK